MTPEDSLLLWLGHHPTHPLTTQAPAELFSPQGQDALRAIREGHSRISETGPSPHQAEVLRYFQKQTLALIGREIGRAQRSGRLDAVRLLLDLHERGLDAPDEVEPFRNIEPDPPEVIPTGIAPIDDQIRGLARTELGIIFMPPGRGKTNFLINLAVGATNLGRSVHYMTVADQSKHELVPRIDTCLLNEPVAIDAPRAVFLERHRRAKRLLRASLWISDFTDRECSITDVDRAVASCEADLVLVDHADDVASPYSDDPSSTRHSLRVVYMSLKRLAKKHNVPIWTASQSNEQSWFARATSLSDMSEAKVGKATGAAIILGFSGGPATEQIDGQAYCTICKARRFYTDRVFTVGIDRSRMKVW
jgi:hypothetical protein